MSDTPKADEPSVEKANFWHELKSFFWLLLAVLAFHSFIAKPFYIPSESMMPNLLKGDRLVVNKFAYGWSFVSPTIPNPAAVVRTLTGGPPEPWGITLPPMKGRLFGTLPTRGDIVIITPPGSDADYIKRVIGLPGDLIEMQNGQLRINGEPVLREPAGRSTLPLDPNIRCGDEEDPAFYDPGMVADIIETDDGREICALPLVRETLPNGVSFLTVDLGPTETDDFTSLRVPDGHLFLMGDNRDRSADSRVPLEAMGLGGPVPWENIGGRAEFITFSLDGSASFDPRSWFGSFRKGRAGDSLRVEPKE